MTTNELEATIIEEANDSVKELNPRTIPRRLSNPPTLEGTLHRSENQKAPEYYPAEAMLGVSFVSALVGGVVGHNSLEISPYVNAVAGYFVGGTASMALFTVVNSGIRGAISYFRND